MFVSNVLAIVELQIEDARFIGNQLSLKSQLWMSLQLKKSVDNKSVDLCLVAEISGWGKNLRGVTKLDLNFRSKICWNMTLTL